MKFKALAAGVLMAMAGGANASMINGGDTGNGGDLFISIFDTVTQNTYFLNTHQNFLNVKTPGFFYSVDLSKDANFSGFAGHALQYNMAAANSLNVAGTNIADWGFIASAHTATDLANDFGSVDGTRQNITSYEGALNGKLLTADSAMVPNGSMQSWNDPTWGSSFGAAPGAMAPLVFGVGETGHLFFVTNDGLNGSTIQGEAFSLNAAGVLTIGTAPTSAVPVPAAVWLLGSALMGLVTIGRRGSIKA